MMNIVIHVDSLASLRQRLSQAIPPKSAKLYLRLPEHDYVTQLISVPEYFNSTDIEQHIHLEQATYFPHISESIYFDFEANKKGEVLVYAIGVSKVEHLLNVVAEFHIPAQRVIIQPMEGMINFLPWREWQRETQKRKKRWAIIAGSSVGCLLMASSYTLVHRDIHRLSLEQARLKQILAPYQAMIDQQAQAEQLKKEQAKQLHSLCLLKEIEVLRPPDLVLRNITLKARVLMVDGQAKTMQLINRYEGALKGACAVQQVKLLSIEKGTDKTFPWVFSLQVS